MLHSRSELSKTIRMSRFMRELLADPNLRRETGRATNNLKSGEYLVARAAVEQALADRGLMRAASDSIATAVRDALVNHAIPDANKLAAAESIISESGGDFLLRYYEDPSLPLQETADAIARRLEAYRNQLIYQLMPEQDGSFGHPTLRREIASLLKKAFPEMSQDHLEGTVSKGLKAAWRFASSSPQASQQELADVTVASILAAVE